MGTEDIELLRLLNLRIGHAESTGDPADRAWLASILAPEFAFMRADGVTFDNTDRYLSKLTAGSPRETLIREITILGRRAVVRCTVTMGGRDFDNLRLFVGVGVGRGAAWKLLAWANEVVPPIAVAQAIL